MNHTIESNYTYSLFEEDQSQDWYLEEEYHEDELEQEQELDFS